MKKRCYYVLSASLGSKFTNGKWFSPIFFPSFYKLWRTRKTWRSLWERFFWKSISDSVIWSQRLRFHYFYIIAILHFENLWRHQFCYLFLILPYSLTELYDLVQTFKFLASNRCIFAKMGIFWMLCMFGFYWKCVINWPSLLSFSYVNIVHELIPFLAPFRRQNIIWTFSKPQRI